MKNFYRLVPKLPTPATRHGEECLKKIRAMLTEPEPEKIERQPGEDREEDA